MLSPSSQSIYLENDDIYINKIIDHLLSNSYSEIDNLTIILPNYYSLEIFKNKYLSKILKLKKAIKVPEIITLQQFYNIYYKSPYYINLSYQEEILVLTKLIIEDNSYEIDVVNAAKLSKELYRIFNDFKKYELQIDDIYKWLDQDLAKHWWDLSSFLSNIFRNFEQVINQYSFSIKYNLQNKYFIFIGISDNLDNEIDKLSEFTNSLFISPILLDILVEKFDNLKRVYNSLDNNKLLIFKNNLSQNNKIFNEFYDVFDEFRFVFDKITSSEDDILVIINDDYFFRLLSSELDLLNIEYNSTFKEPYLNFEESEFLLNLAIFKSSDGSLFSYSNILKSRIFDDLEHIDNVIELLDSKDLFFNDFYDLINFIDNEWVKSLNEILLEWLNFKGSDFNEILDENYNVFIKIYKKFNLKTSISNSEKFDVFVRNIINFNVKYIKIELEDYSNYLKEILTLKYSRVFSKTSKISICKFEDIAILDSKEIIICNFNKESVLGVNDNDVWLTNKILKKIGLVNDNEKYETIKNIIDSISSKNITFTRAIYKDGELLEKCPIINSYSNVIYNKFTIDYKEKYLLNYQDDFIIKSSELPEKLYASNIELLSRNPYGFFIRKVLKIIPKKKFTDTPQNSDFGTLIHKVLEEISNSEASDYKNLLNKIYNEFNHTQIYRLLTEDRILNIIKEFKLYNANSKNNYKIYSEIEGKLEINLRNNKKIIISAIADRIEISDKKIRIIDFKTGSPPTYKDISYGKSPQLVIEAMIAISDGFNNIIFNSHEIEVVYIKVNSKEPYFEEKSYILSCEEIKQHQIAMINFLEFYYLQDEIKVSKEKLPDFWRLNFDDYEFYRRELE